MLTFQVSIYCCLPTTSLYLIGNLYAMLHPTNELLLKIILYVAYSAYTFVQIFFNNTNHEAWKLRRLQLLFNV